MPKYLKILCRVSLDTFLPDFNATALQLKELVEMLYFSIRNREKAGH